MAMPPNTPIKKGNSDMTYFQYLTYMAAPIVQEYDPTINLDFTGYFDTINKYKSLGIMEWKKAMELSKEINAWSEYISEISNLVQASFLNAELFSNERQAITSINYDSKYVSNGNRLAFQDSEVIEAQKKRNIIKALNDELSAKVRFLERAFYHCKSIGETGHKSSYILRENIIKAGDSRKEEKELPGYYMPNKKTEDKSDDNSNKEE